jgi:hypothetical protein
VGNVENLSTFCVDNSLGSCKRERTEKIRGESLEMLNKIHIIRRSKDAWGEKVKRESGKEETLAPHSKGLSTNAVDNPSTKCAEVKILTKIAIPPGKKARVPLLVGKDAVVIEHADMSQRVVDA